MPALLSRFTLHALLFTLPPVTHPNRLCEVRRLGRLPYADWLVVQKAIVEGRVKNQFPDVFCLVEHPHVFTLGSSGKAEHILADEQSRAQLGIEVFKTGRGGDVTYHGPGQVVGYPVINLKPDRCDVHRYVRDLEEVMIRTLADYGIDSGRIPGLTGVWAGNEKIGAIGVRISRWITHHGFAFNVNSDMNFFKMIVPCGISDRGVTSLERLTGRSHPLAEVEDHLIRHFGGVFGREMLDVLCETRSIQVFVCNRSNGKTRYLLLRRTDERGGFWQPVTGGVEEGESWEEAAAREVREETGISGPLVDLNFKHTFAVHPRFWPMNPHYTMKVNLEAAFLIETTHERVTLDSREHQEYAWLEYDEAMSRLVWDGNKQALERTRATLGEMFATPPAGQQ